METFLEQNSSPLPPRQFGFRTERYTVGATQTVVDIGMAEKIKGKNRGLCTLITVDFKNA